MGPPLVPDLYHGFLQYRNESAKADDYTITLNDNGTLFTNGDATASMTFTLPPCAPNLAFGFRVTADYNVTIAANGDEENLLVLNNAAAGTLQINRPAGRVGAGYRIESNAAGDQWRVTDTAPSTSIITCPRWRQEVAKTGDYTITANDNGTLFTNGDATAAVNFTLPAIDGRLLFGFRVVANQNLTITSPEGDNIVAFNDAAADSLAFSSSNGKIGGGLILESNAAADKWYATNISAGSNTITVSS